jgi:hypothetical protein
MRPSTRVAVGQTRRSDDAAPTLGETSTAGFHAADLAKALKTALFGFRYDGGARSG